ncbi:transglycosylase SLT domain-containing protein [Acinetobacter sp. NigerLNRRAM0016]
MADDLLGRVQILLEADTTRLETGMAGAERITDRSVKSMKTGFQGVTSEVKKTQNQVDSFSKSISEHETEVRSIAKSYDVAALAVKGLSAVAAGVSIGSLTSYASNYISKASEIQKFATLVGSSTQQFQYYAAGAEAAGIGIDKFSDLGKDALDKLGDAMAGQGEMMDFFDQIAPKIGVTIEQFKGLSGPEVIQKYYNGLQQANLEHPEVVKFMEQIADEGSLLIPMLKDGGAGFIQWGDAAQRAGAILSDSMIKDLKQAKDNIALLSLEWQGFQANIVNNVVPTLELLKENSDSVQAGAIALAAYVGTQLVMALGKATIAGYAKATQLRDQIVVQMTAIQLEKQAAAQDLIGAQAQVVNTQATLSALAAERALELQRLKAQISAQGLAASQTRLAEISVIESQVKKELVLANNALAASQARVTAAQASSLTVGRSLLGFLGGPIGLGLTVATVAASYLLLKDNTSDVSSTLDMQGHSVDELKEKWRDLNSIQKDTLALGLEKSIEDLRVKYVTASSDLNAWIGYIEDSGRVSEKVARQIQEQYKEYSKGRITADEFYSSIKAINGISDEQVVKLRGLITANQNSKQAYEEVKQKRDALVNSTPNAVSAQNAETEAIRKKNQELQKTKALQESYAQKNLKNDFLIKNTAVFGGGQKGFEKSQAVTEFYSENKIPMTRSLTAQEYDIFNKWYEKQQAVKTLQESITASEKERTKEIEKQQKILQVNAKVQMLSSKYDISSRAAAAGIPQGLIEAMIMQESKGNKNAVGPVTKNGERARGLAQFMPGTAKQYGVNVFDEESSINGMIKYMSVLIKQFGGDIDKAVMAYNAGPTNVENGRAYGFKETKGYLSNVKSYTAGVNGFVGTSSDFEKSLQYGSKALADALEEQDRIREQYATKWEQLEKTHTENVEDIRNAFANDTTTRDMLLQRENERHAVAIEDWVKYEDRRVKEEQEANQEIIRARQEAFQAMNGPMSQLAEIGINAQAQVGMSPAELSRWKQNNQQQDGYSELGDYLGQANEAIRNNELLTQQERYAQLEDVYRQYLESKRALGEQYALQEQELAKSQHQEQLNLWGSLVSQAQNTWSQVTQAVKDSAGEQSVAYKIAFLAQQTFSIASTLISAHLAATQAAADPSNITLPGKIAASEAMLAMGYANAGLIAAQTIAGVFHGGTDYVPKESSYLLDEGERVLSPRQNQDLTSYLANRENAGSSGSVQISQSITFTDTGAQVDTQGQKEVAQSLNNMMDAWARRESRQGGVLYNLSRGK